MLDLDMQIEGSLRAVNFLTILVRADIASVDLIGSSTIVLLPLILSVGRGVMLSRFLIEKLQAFHIFALILHAFTLLRIDSGLSFD